MAASSNSKTQLHPFDVRLLEKLACPVCFGVLGLALPGREIVCAGCRRMYPLIDGIPVLIAERAKTAAVE
jgi:uncharacterized protein YbaR (Trm112 family)